MIKKLLAVLLLVIHFITTTNATEYTWTWTGANGNNYSDAGNWSISPAADANTASMGYPRNLLGHTSIVVFNKSGSIELPLASTVAVSEIRIQSGTVSLNKTTIGNIEIQLDGLGINISSGARLNVVSDVQGIKLLMTATANNSTISGILDLTGNAGSQTSSTGPSKLEQQNFISPKWTVASGGKIILSGLNAQVVSTTASSLKFLSGSSIDITRSGGTIPTADYQVGSIINVTGNTNGATSFSNSYDSFNGEIVWNCPSQTTTTFNAQWSLSSTFPTNFKGKFTMKAGYLRFIGAGLTTQTFGSFDIQGGTLELGYGSGTATPSVLGDVTVSGGTLKVNGSDFNGNVTLSVNGNLNQTGGTINVASGITGIGTLIVIGNVNQTGGVITETGTTTSSVLTFGGINAQNATLAAGGLGGDALNVEINKSSNHVSLLTTLTIPRNLILTSNCIKLGGNNVVVNNLVTGGSATSHVVTDGIGTLKILGVDAVGKNFPVGVTTTSFDPVNIKNTTGTNDFAVSVGGAITAGVPSTYTNIIPRQWEIISTSASAILAFTPGTGAAGSPDIGHYTGGAWVFAASSTASPTYTGTFTSFSPFIIAGQVLPVELISFKAKKLGNVNALNWQTGSEKNNSHFDVERSNNGQINWANMGMVKGHGNSLVTQNYSFSDNAPLSISYYRLKQVDNDGNFSYSNVVSVVDKKGKFNIASVAPNPTNETSTILFESAKNENVLVTLTDLSGRVILTQNAAATEGVNALNINMSSLSNGLYIVRLSNNEQVLIQKLIKE